MVIIPEKNRRTLCVSSQAGCALQCTFCATGAQGFDQDLSSDEIKVYLSKISDEALYAYNVYQIEDQGRNLFLNINGDKDTIMCLPIKKIKEYLDNYRK